MTHQGDEKVADKPGLRFTLRELVGSFGDLGTFLPLCVALAVTTELNFAAMLIAAGLMNIATGLLFRLPVPVQPMKAIAAVAIAEGLSGGAVVAAGWGMGAALTLISITGLIPWLDRLIPTPIVRAIQLGVGLKLLLHALECLPGLPAVGPNSLLVALAAAGLILLGTVQKWPVVLPLFLAGFAIILFEVPSAYQTITINSPQLNWIVPSEAEWKQGLIQGALPQLPLTLLNSVIAVCALSGDYFPKNRIESRRMASSVGMMNLLCVGWSGLPMCHGAGGLAAQYRAGARTGGSVIMLGGIKVALGIAFGVSLLPLLQSYPVAILAPFIGFAGVSLAYNGCLVNKVRDGFVILPSALVTVATQTLYGFLAGIILTFILTTIQPKPPRE
ncbi:MAG: putative sulfate/molybdate transporter [Planctomycetota bacterium]